MDELKFINLIDANFPYSKKDEWQKIVLEGTKIGDNAIFAILHEICRPPKSADVGLKEKLEIYNFVIKKFKNKGKFEFFLKLILKIIEGKKIPLSETVMAIKRLKRYPSSYSLLGILYFASDDKNNYIEDAYNEVLGTWENNG